MRTTTIGATLATTLLLAACGGGGGGGGGGGMLPPGSGQQRALNELGVDTSPTSRLDDEGDALPENYAPFGMMWELNKTDELVFLGLELGQNESPISLLELTDEGGEAVEDLLYERTESQAPWALEELTPRAFPLSLRDGTAADVDGDGFEEMVFVYANGIELRIALTDDASANFAFEDQQVALESSGVDDVTVVGADLDGDGDDELVVGVSQGSIASIAFFDRVDGRFEEISPRLSRTTILQGAAATLDFATGNLDQDPADEIVAVLNEYSGPTESPITTVTYTVLDDLSQAFSPFFSPRRLVEADQNGAIQTALLAWPAIGDVDGDNKGEVLLGGLTELSSGCNPISYFFVALDDADVGLGLMASRSIEYNYNCSAPDDPRIRTVFINALDLDGDGRDEVSANTFFFEDFVDAAPWTESNEAVLEEGLLFRSGDFGHFDRSTASMITADFTNDGREDLAIFRQDRGAIVVVGLDQIQGFRRLREIAVPFANSQSPINPLLVSVNVDADTPVMSYSEAERRLVFSEPIVVAALAAPPCNANITQNTDACRTAFGNTQSTGGSSERSVTVRSSNSVGLSLDVPFLPSTGFAFQATATAAASQIVSRSYTLSKTILFTTGPNEDTVVFTTIPIDQFIYTIQSHPDPSLVGGQVVVNLARDPITLQVERSFYNLSVAPGSPQIDGSVFTHIIGNPASYPGRGEKDGILAGTGGLQIGPQSVGQGTGDTELTLEVGEEISVGGSLEVGYEVSLETSTLGVTVGASIGSSVSNTISVTSGTATSYTGVVGSISDVDFAENRYRFGLFTYLYTDVVSGQEYQVLNYWVD